MFGYRGAFSHGHTLDDNSSEEAAFYLVPPLCARRSIRSEGNVLGALFLS